METIVWKRNDDYIILNRLVIIFLAMDKLILFPLYQKLLNLTQDLHSLKLKHFPRHQVSL